MLSIFTAKIKNLLDNFQCERQIEPQFISGGNMKITALILAAFLSSAAFADVCSNLKAAIAKGSEKQKLDQYLKVQWQNLMMEYPEWATYVGFPGQNDRWSDRSLSAIERRKKEDKCQLAILAKINRAGLKGEDRINFDLSKRNLERQIEGQRFPDEFFVLDHLGGLHMEVADMMRDMPSSSVKEYEDMLSRLDKVPVIEAQTEILLREGLKRKITPVKMFLERVPSQFDRVLTAKVEDSPLFEKFKVIKADIPTETKLAITARAKQIIETKVYPALKALKKFVVEEYIPGAREDIAFSDMPDGKAWYAYKVKGHTTTDLTPDQLHNLGLSEVARIHTEMEAVKDKVKFRGDLNAFNKFLLTDKRFTYDTKEELLAGYRDIAKRIDAELPKMFKTLPRLTYGVREMPEYKAKESPGAYYESGSLEAGRAGYFTANTYDLRARHKWSMEALTAHEGVPGHHFQISIAQELTDLPEIRRHGSYTAFVEGWGLYAESLGPEINLYNDPYSQYGQLTYEIWRAIRLVVDTGIHSKGWTRQQAIDYFLANMPKSRLESEVEVDRYITWPGQALAYKVGELKFKELRKSAKAELGDNFDLREFHDQLLKHGALPMDVLEKTIHEWVASVKASKLSKKSGHKADT
jgi:uncharacterized protein (DUF885 family)